LRFEIVTISSTEKMKGQTMKYKVIQWITGMPLLNAIGEVCKAKPGILTSADLPVRDLMASGRRK